MENKKTKYVTSFYAYHDGYPYWGRSARAEGYMLSIISICNIGSELICYTDAGDLGYDQLIKLKEDHNLHNLVIKVYELRNNPYFEKVVKIRTDDPDYGEKVNSKSSQIYAMKFKFLEFEYEPNINLYWIDCGLSHEGMFPEFASSDERFSTWNGFEDPVTGLKRRWFFDRAFNPETVQRINEYVEDKIVVMSKESCDEKVSACFEALQVNGQDIIALHRDVKRPFPVGGFFGGNSDKVLIFCKKFEELFHIALDNGYAGNDQEFMYYLLWKYNDMFKNYEFDTFCHAGKGWQYLWKPEWISFSELFIDPKYIIR